MRKLFILCTAFLLVSSFVMPNLTVNAEDTALSFEDIGTTHRAQDEIYYLAEGTIVNGSLDGNFYPNRNVTRAEAAAMIGRSLNLDGTKRVTDFSDVGSSQFASGYIQSAVNHHIITGYHDGTFKPNQPVTRGEMAILIYRAFKYGATNVSTLTAANELMERGISQGTGDGTFGTNQQIIRADFAVFLARAIDPTLRTNNELHVIGQKSVTANVLNMRTGPSTNYETIKGLVKGTTVDILEKIGDWAYVQVNGAKGFVHAGYLGEAEAETPETPEVPEVPGDSETPEVPEVPGDSETPEVPEVPGDSETPEIPEVPGDSETPEIPEVPEVPEVPETPPANQVDQFIQSQTIVIDPGHGGSDPGAIGSGLHEADTTLAISLKVQSLFKGTGFHLAMTREKDVYPTLGERVAFAKKVGGDIFLSIHANAAGSSASGTETYYYRTAATNPYVTDSKKLATCIQERMVKAWGLADRGVKIGDLYVLRENNMPSALLELGFITNQGDANKLNSSDWQQRAAVAVYLGILDYYKEKTGYDFSNLYSRVNF